MAMAVQSFFSDRTRVDFRQQRLVQTPQTAQSVAAWECVNFPCSHTHRLRSAHRDTHASLFGQHQSSRSVQWQQLWQSTCSWKINWSSKLVCVCDQKCLTQVFHFETAQQTAPARPLFFSAPPHKFFSSKSRKLQFFHWGGDFSLVFNLPAIFRVEFWNSWIGE